MNCVIPTLAFPLANSIFNSHFFFLVNLKRRNKKLKAIYFTMKQNERRKKTINRVNFQLYVYFRYLTHLLIVCFAAFFSCLIFFLLFPLYILNWYCI